MKTLLVSIISVVMFCSCQRQTIHTTSIPLNREEPAQISDGYSTKDQKNYTGAASELKGFDNNITLDNYLRRVSGITVRGDGADAQILVRGIATVYGDPSPLFVLNGTVFSGGFSVLYNTVNVNDIKSVSVLKDASSTGIYGSRAANGVIVIDLKKTENKK